MLKCILLLLSEYYYEIVSERVGEIREKTNPYGVQVSLRKIDSPDKIRTGCEEVFGNGKSTLIITDHAKAAEILLEEKQYVVILYHEGNRQQNFPAVRYGIEDLFQIAYRSFEEVYLRLAGLPWEIFRTKRLLVRESTLEDVDEFYRIYKEPSITRYMEDLYEDRDEEKAYMKSYIDQIYGFYGYGLWTVILKESGRIIGRAGLSVREGCENPELGFLIDASYQRQGYGFEVCSGILKYAQEELKFEKIQALVDERNTVSIGLVNKLGFVFQENVTANGQKYGLYIKKLCKKVIDRIGPE